MARRRITVGILLVTAFVSLALVILHFILPLLANLFMGLGVDVPMVVVEHPYSVLAAGSLIFLVTVWLVTALAMHLARRPASKKS